MAGRVRRHERFTDWVREMLGLRRQATPPPDEIAASIDAAIAQARASGTGLVGDISNSLATVDPLRRSDLRGVVFHELLRLRASDADDVLEQGLLALERAGASERMAVSLAPHAPYSGVAAALPGHPRRARAHAVSADVRAPGRVAGGGRAARDGAGAVAPAAGGSRRVGSGVAASRLWTGRVPGSDEAARTADARGTRRAVRRGRARAAGRDRRDAGDLSAQQRVCRRRRAARGTVLSGGRPRGHRHRQPGERGRPQSVRGAGGAARARAGGVRGLAAGQCHGPGRPRAGIRGRFRHD